MESETPDIVITNRQGSPRTSNEENGRPSTLLHICRTPNLKHVVSAWMIYDDVNTKFDVQKGWILPSTTLPRPYEIREVEAKGRGMFATRKIAKGEVIAREMPLIIVPCSNMYSVESDLVQLLGWLEPEDREAYFSLHNCKPESECGCYPNAGYVADEETVTVKLLAVRDIDLGQEICISYTSLLDTRVVRLGILRRNYGFRCTCTECADTPENKAKEETRKFTDLAMASLDKRMDEWTAGCPQSRAAIASRDIEYCMQILHAMDGEKAYYGERMQASRYLAHIYGGLGDVKNFKKWSFMTAWLLRLGGSPMYLIWEFWYANP